MEMKWIASTKDAFWCTNSGTSVSSQFRQTVQRVTFLVSHLDVTMKPIEVLFVQSGFVSLSQQQHQQHRLQQQLQVKPQRQQQQHHLKQRHQLRQHLQPDFQQQPHFLQQPHFQQQPQYLPLHLSRFLSLAIHL